MYRFGNVFAAESRGGSGSDPTPPTSPTLSLTLNLNPHNIIQLENSTLNILIQPYPYLYLDLNISSFCHPLDIWLNSFLGRRIWIRSNSTPWSFYSVEQRVPDHFYPTKTWKGRRRRQHSLQLAFSAVASSSKLHLLS